MTWEIVYFNAAVQKDVTDWPVGIRAAYQRLVERMEEHGPNLGMPFTRAMGDGLYEIRAKGREGIGRAFFCTVIGHRVVVLHTIIKKSQKTPLRALDIARRRMRMLTDE